MVEKAVGRHSPPLKGLCGVAQGNPLLPTIFNIGLDSIMSHWVAVVAEEEVGLEVLRWSIL